MVGLANRRGTKKIYEVYIEKAVPKEHGHRSDTYHGVGDARRAFKNPSSNQHIDLGEKLGSMPSVSDEL